MSVRRPRGEEEEEENDGGGDQGSGADGGGGGDHGRPCRRIRPAAFSFRSVARRAATAETIQQIVLSLEPEIRRAVREEFQNIFAHHNALPYRSLNPLRIQEANAAPPPAPQLKLAFTKRLMLPIFTNNKLVDASGNGIEVRLLDARTNHPVAPANTHLGSHASPVRLEVLVLDGDFRCDDGGGGDGWTDHQFSAAVVKAREGRRPLLVGTLSVVMSSDHGVAVVDDVSFTDNSSWIRSRRFRLGVRVVAAPAVAVAGSYYGHRIREAVSESFTVKDHRGELYKKHYPPALTDNVWRLKNIGKDGPIDKRLESEGIKNVHDFLKLNTMDPEKLKNLVGMSDRQWRTTLNHAKTCEMGEKCYVFKSEACDLIFSPIGDILAARIGDQLTCSLQQLHQQQTVLVKQLALEAYQKWDQLEETANETALAGCECQLMMQSFRQEKKPSSSCTPASNDSMISCSAGSQNDARYLDDDDDNNMGSGSANSNAVAVMAVATNSGGTSLDSAAAVPGSDDAMYWSPGMAADHFSWQNPAGIGCWDQIE